MGSPKEPTRFLQYVQRQRDSHLGNVPWNKGMFQTPDFWIKRFNQKYVIKNNCWVWIGGKYTNGYGMFWVNGKSIGAHVFSYEFFNGPIPTKLVVDHLCKDKSCVNPNHLDLTTRYENVLRGSNIIAKNHSKIYCPFGHEYNENNTYITKNGYRMCRMCMARRSKIRKQKEKELRRINKIRRLQL